MSKYILTIDQSTTGTKSVLFDRDGGIVADESLTHRQYYPAPGWVEQDAEEIFDQTTQVIQNVLKNSGVSPEDVLALAITVQTGAFVVWDKNTGKPVHHIIGWQCNRGEEICARLSDKEKEIILRKSGTNASPFLPAAKLCWMLEHIDGLAEAAGNGSILFGTIESWLIWKLTGGKTHASDYCNASITQLFDQESTQWDDELLQIFHIPRIILPELYDADAEFGTVDVPGLPPLSITGVIGDSAAALFGQCGFHPGDVKITYGTGSSILMNLGNVPQPPAEGMTTSIGWRWHHGETIYVWEGTAVCTGAVVSWLVSDMEMLSNASQSEEIAGQVADAQGVYLVPAFTGLGTPYRDSAARACITGMSAGTKKAHVVRAALDSIAYQIRDMVESMQRETKEAVPYLLVDGGVTKNALLMQFQSDILGIPVLRSQAKESSALGVFYMAGLSVGLFDNAEQLRTLGEKKQQYEPRMDPETREKLYQGWKKAIRQSRMG